MDLSQKSKDLNRSERQTLSVNLTGSINNQKTRESTDSLLVDSLQRKERIQMAINVKASEYQKVLNNHLKAVESGLKSAGITDKKVVGKALNNAEGQFRNDFNATGGKHEDFFDSNCTAQLRIVEKEIRTLNQMNPTGKMGVQVEVGTICKKI